MSRPLTLWQAIKLSGWTERLLAAAACFSITMNTIALALLLIIGVLGGGWAWRSAADILSTLALSSIALGYVYWRRRALEGEKPRATTAVLTV